MFFRVSTWEQKQGPLLGAVAIEQSILNILLFFIIAVAGFGILAIFSMIVVEKTRDIGVMKALGASTAGIRGIFLGYGLLLGAVGSGVGMAGGLLFVHYINEIETAPEQGDGPQGLRRLDLLFRQDPDARRAVHRRLDRGRCDVDRRAGQHLAGPAGGPRCTRSGRCASNDRSRRRGSVGSIPSTRSTEAMPTEDDDDDRPLSRHAG